MSDVAFDAPCLVPDALADGGKTAPHIVVGVTRRQTRLILDARLRALRTAGFRVTLIADPENRIHCGRAVEGVESIDIPMRREIAPMADAIALIRLIFHLRRLKPDMTEFSTPKAGLLGTVAARFTGVPHRVYMLRGLKLDTATGWKRRILLLAERTAAACSHVVLCNSKSLRRSAVDLGLAAAEKVVLLGNGSSNGVDTAWFSPGQSLVRSKLGISQRVPVLGFVGRLTRDKGVPELVDAFERILAVEPDTHLLLVGWFDDSEDALGAELRLQIESHPRIHCVGYVEDTAPYYRAMDVMILPTWREGFPNVVLEAASTGVPVITTLSTGSRDAVVPEVTGFLVAPGYPEALFERALELIRNPERRLEMGAAARRWIIRHYARERVLELTTEFYKSLLSGCPERQTLTSRLD